MINEVGRSLEEEVRKQLQENQEKLDEMYRLLQKINRHLVWQQVMGWVKVLLIVVPLLLAYWYLAPYLTSAFSVYKNLLGGGSGTSQTIDLSNVDPQLLQRLSPEMLEQLQKSLK